MKQWHLLPLCLVAVFGVGCIPLSSQEATDLRIEMSQLQIQYAELRQNCANLCAKIDSVSETLSTLDAAIQDLQSEKYVLSRLVGNESRDRQGDSLLPSSLYQGAYGDYSIGKFELACSGFQSFINKYPNDRLAVQAQFYMGECFYSLGIWEKALNEYEKVELQYRETYLVPSARLKIALCYELLSEHDKAIKVFSSIVKDFPQAPESLMAKEKLKMYDNAQER